MYNATAARQELHRNAWNQDFMWNCCQAAICPLSHLIQIWAWKCNKNDKHSSLPFVTPEHINFYQTKQGDRNGWYLLLFDDYRAHDDVTWLMMSRWWWWRLTSGNENMSKASTKTSFQWSWENVFKYHKCARIIFINTSSRNVLFIPISENFQWF